jgi:hypothetical protein
MDFFIAKPFAQPHGLARATPFPAPSHEKFAGGG